MNDRIMRGGLEVEVKLEQETYRAGSDPLCRGVIRFRVPRRSPLRRRPISTHLCVVMDISGSMDVPDKYPMLLDAVRQLCQGLTESQRLTLIVFSGEADTVALAVDGSTAAKTSEDLIWSIERMPFKFGETYLAPAMELALAAVKHQRALWPHMLPRLYVMTDGQLFDHADCLRFSDYLAEEGVEFMSYGFGDNFALDTMREIIGSCDGGGVKHVPDGTTLKETFRHLARVGRRVVATHARVQIDFEEDVIPGDAFSYRPVPRWHERDLEQQGLNVNVGPVELKRTYVLAFEARVPRRTPGRHSLGTVQVAYRTGDLSWSDRAPISVSFTESDDDVVNGEVRDMLDDVASQRDSDVPSLLCALRARRRVFQREYRHRDEIRSVERAIEILEETGSLEDLPEQERREVEADRNTILVEDRDDELSRLLDVDGRPFGDRERN